ncbi:hypothetical protein [Streptomyces naphthomycinicus]|uniref:hypothetical protein n=1 Tax=Streptomyces naphthomycinicus TaxID=2872625 RepID=UPI001CED55F3|nr:hypothetical protein [Streptomyces sp. TML10]
MSTATRSSVVGTAALLVACLAGVTGCSSGSGQGEHEGDSPLLKGLGTLADDNGKGQVTYLDAAAVRRLDKDDTERFAAIGQPNNSLLNAYSPGPWKGHLTGDQIDTAVDAKGAGRWEGSFDEAAITAALKANGYAPGDEDGRRTWTRPHGKGAALEVSKDTVSYAVPGTAPMSAVHPERGSSLADAREYRRAAGCLGDVYRADFNPLTASAPVRLSALGQQADSTGRNTEVLCVVVKDEATARRLSGRLRSVVRDKSPRYDGAKVTVEKGEQPLVRAAVPDSAAQRPGRLLLSDIDLWMAVVER